MTPGKSFLFIVFCFFSVVALGMSLSHAWRINKKLASEAHRQTQTASLVPAAPTLIEAAQGDVLTEKK